RFDVPFLVARMPAGQVPVADEAEQFEPVWVRPGDALARHHAGQFFMIFPTIRTLERLVQFDSVAAVLQACAGEQPLWTSCPRAGLLQGAEARYMEHESPYGELALVCPDGQIQHQLDWRTDQPVALLKNLVRITAPNPGVMTGPGTNCYLVGDPDTGYIVVDPGPNEPEHQQRIWRATGGDIRLIVCTHSHADHSPGARPLQALCKTRPPILGLPSAATARPASEFTPDRAVRDGEVLSVEAAGVSHSLKVLHTPGHAANHVCLVLLEDGLLLSGDHILNGSTTVVDPPDGDMTAYLDSLDALSAACDQYGIEFILPAHGYVLGFAKQAIAHLKAHRLQREARIVAAMRERPTGTLEDWVELAYADVPQRMWPVAKRSLLAHVQRIEAMQAVR
ncbi:MAG: beta-lactamase-like protein, partial [Ramlibacter sp.]|nr:beta-lactamase-like protein [Ramlibacter sp.]